jgi:N-acetyl-anhydromuramyl-L-alanine amidase AmpD
VRDPPPPYFGPRVSSGSLAAATVPTPKSVTLRDLGRQASGNTSEWRVDGPERPWRYIVIHHSATPTGSADEFDRMHRAKGWDELGYHFVIGNGTGSGNGEVEIGGRWTKQKHGAHAKIPGHPEYNDVGIGICLVGNFDVTRPTEAQMASLAKLVRFLMDRYGIPRAHIYGHGQLKPTDCPGKNFNYDDLFRRL